MFVCCVCFQAEDGIRDLVRSRGLGDVYKRQRHASRWPWQCCINDVHQQVASTLGVQNAFIRVGVYQGLKGEKLGVSLGAEAVSYTHLTLPTSDLV